HGGSDVGLRAISRWHRGMIRWPVANIPGFDGADRPWLLRGINFTANAGHTCAVSIDIKSNQTAREHSDRGLGGLNGKSRETVEQDDHSSTAEPYPCDALTNGIARLVAIFGQFQLFYLQLGVARNS